MQRWITGNRLLVKWEVYEKKCDNWSDCVTYPIRHQVVRLRKLDNEHLPGKLYLRQKCPLSQKNELSFLM